MFSIISPQKIAVIAFTVLSLSACDKNAGNKTSSAASTPASIPIAVTSASSQPSPAVVSHNASNFAKVQSVAIVGQFLIGYANNAKLDSDKRNCLLNADLEKASPAIQKIFDTSQTPEDKKAFNEVYGGDTGQRTVAFTKQSIAYAMGQTGSEPPQMQAADKAKVDAFNNSPAALRLQQSLNEKQLLEATLPVVNAQLRQCQLTEVPIQAVLAELSAPVASASKP